jgi:hypothetical protein
MLSACPALVVLSKFWFHLELVHSEKLLHISRPFAKHETVMWHLENSPHSTVLKVNQTRGYTLLFQYLRSIGACYESQMMRFVRSIKDSLTR